MPALAEWKTAKKAFETATGRKKPGAKFMGAFKKSSGMESACKALDEASKRSDEAKMLKAEAAYQKAMNSYNKTLDTALRSDKGDAYKAELKKLQNAMEQILVGFVGLRNNARKELFKALAKKSKELYEEMDRRFKVCQQDQKIAEGQAGDCDSALREVIDFSAKNRNTEAKQSAKKLAVAVKAVGEVHKRVVKNKDEMQKHYNKVTRDWSADESRFTDSESPVRAMRDKADAYNYAADTIVQSIEELVDDAKKASDDCTKALKGGLDATATYIASGERLQRRAVSAVATFDQTYRDIGGEIDKASQDRMNGDESKDDAQKKRLYAQARGMLKAQKGRMRELAQGLARSKKDIQRQLKGFPASIKTHSDFKPILDDINKAIGFLDEIDEGLKKEATKLNREEGKIPK